MIDSFVDAFKIDFSVFATIAAPPESAVRNESYSQYGRPDVSLNDTLIGDYTPMVNQPND